MVQIRNFEVLIFRARLGFDNQDVRTEAKKSDIYG